MKISIRAFAAFQMVAIAAAMMLTPMSHAEDAKAEPKVTDRRHPDYVRCKSEKVIGSLSKRNRVCMTNREWEETSRRGNDLAREMANDNTSRPGGN